jgi:ATP-binding cassette, subfamily B, bacterial MsbA
VHFRYPGADRDALAGVDLDIAPGETVALVGASGSGKTTMMALIPRFYGVASGNILLDGVDLHDLKLADLRANLSLVTQNTVLFNDTVAANIAYGAQREVSEADIVAAAEAAHAMEFIRELPQGLATHVGENGGRLSGGQRQRLAIARALLKDAPILLLDEATSALDTQSERAVQAAIENLKRGRTTLVIAHRLSTIVNADRIVVMKGGRVAEMGTHHELLDKDGIYRQLYRQRLRFPAIERARRRRGAPSCGCGGRAQQGHPSLPAVTSWIKNANLRRKTVSSSVPTRQQRYRPGNRRQLLARGTQVQRPERPRGRLYR